MLQFLPKGATSFSNYEKLEVIFDHIEFKNASEMVFNFIKQSRKWGKR
jgi:hypothetical protein